MAISGKKKRVNRTKVDITKNVLSKDGLEIVKQQVEQENIHCNVTLIGGSRQEYFQKTYDAVGYKFRFRGKIELVDINGIKWRGMDYVVESITPEFDNDDIIVEAWTKDNYTSPYSQDLFINQIVINGLSSYYNLDEGQGNIAIDSQNRYDGIISSGANFVSGVVNTGLERTTGGEYVTINNADGNFWNGNSFTLSLWFKPYTVDGTEERYIVGDFSSVVIHYDRSFEQTLKMSLSLDGTIIPVVTSTNILNENQLYHLAFSYDSTNGGKIYIDGELKETSTGEGVFDAVGGQQFFSFGNGQVDGIIDEIRLYERQLTDTEVFKLYDKPTFIV